MKDNEPFCITLADDEEKITKVASVSIERNGKKIGEVQLSISILGDKTVFAILDKKSDIESQRYSTRLRTTK
tara:strand:+ start:402 stop:617 length:216 start_codon:yes stop_codon:yes gene_type:complete